MNKRTIPIILIWSLIIPVAIADMYFDSSEQFWSWHKYASMGLFFLGMAVDQIMLLNYKESIKK